MHFVTHRVILQTPHRKISTRLLNLCLRFSDHWLRVGGEGRGGEGLDPGGGDSDMKWTGMLVVSLRGVNF